ncbi:MAG TPA: GIY-YIG nuclease family protein [Methanocorpusculum sp.]|nr:GIY-YIG nuclease family protein [Methanocorpusculum sp.]
MDKGVYCLILGCVDTKSIRIGALGDIIFQSGWYVYTGSALGSGGLDRVRRHIRYYKHQYRSPKWHIDYLMSDNSVYLRQVLCSQTMCDYECDLAKCIGVPGIHGFGSSDCSCITHLFYRPNNPSTEIYNAFLKIGLHNIIKHDIIK